MPAGATSRRPLLLALAVAALAADQLSKFAVDKFVMPGSQRVIIPGFLNVLHTTNPGVAFGLFADSESSWKPLILIGFSVLVIAMLIWLLATNRAGGHLGQCGIALILGGATGNVLDRFLRHRVTDFIDFYFRGYHWYTFNIADSAIVIGAALVVLELFRDGRETTQARA
ncbi:MAG TPA: signal peptidase II [Candidatus Acidoferrales bacterium]